MNNDYYQQLAINCGAIAVSHYHDDVCFNAVERLTSLITQEDDNTTHLKQVNIHKLLSVETLSDCYRLIDAAKTDSRLAKLNAIVFLFLKPKGKRNKMTVLTDRKAYKDLCLYALNSGIGIGFDSCSAPMFLESMVDHPKFQEYEQMAESCESTCFSSYVNVDGIFFPCSFTEGEDEWVDGISVLTSKDFMEVWDHPKTQKFREKLTTQQHKISTSCRKCPTFNLY